MDKVSEPKNATCDVVPSSSTRSFKRPSASLIVFLFVLAIGYWRHGLTGAALAIRVSASFVIACLILTGVVAILIWFSRRWTWGLSVLVLAVFVIVWITVGSDNYLRDFLGLSLGGTFGLLVSPPFWNRFRDQGFRVLRWQGLKALPFSVHVMLGIFAWLGLGLADLMYFQPLPTNTDRFKALTNPDLPFGNLRIGLCLSGGGYRAALLHSGVVAQLEELHVPIHCVTAVSGGSIFASYYVAGGDPKEFVRAVSAGRFNVKRQLLLLHNLIRLPFPVTVPITHVPLLRWWSFSRRDVQANLLDRLFLGGAQLRMPSEQEQELERNDQVGIPRLMLGTTDLIHGWQVGIAREGFLVCGIKEVQQMDAADSEDARPAKLSMAKAVSMSGAFPGAFPAESVELKTRGFFPTTVNVFLADGGIHDNLGYRLMTSARDAVRVEKGSPNADFNGHGWDKHWDVDLIIVSNGGQMFDLEAVSGVGDELARVIGLLSDLPASRQEEVFRKDRRDIGESKAPSDTIFFSPGLITGSPDDWLIFKQSQRKTGRNLDSFWESLRDSLVGLDFNSFRLVLPQIINLCGDQARLKNALHAFRNPPALPTETPRSKAKNNRDALFNGYSESPALRQRRQLAAELASVVVSDIEDCMNAFRKTGTLQDQINSDDAWRIHRLGRYLVLLKWPDLQAEIPAATERRKKLNLEQQHSMEFWEKLRLRSERALSEEATPRGNWAPPLPRFIYAAAGFSQ
jgi:predicted acylesterase/phospholipase RssA